MQTLVPSHMLPKGRLGDKVYVDSITYPYHWRMRPLTAKASLRALKQENKRAGFINKVAGDLNAVMKLHMAASKAEIFIIVCLRNSEGIRWTTGICCYARQRKCL